MVHDDILEPIIHIIINKAKTTRTLFLCRKISSMACFDFSLAVLAAFLAFCATLFALLAV